jgi:hypothetical protein
VTLTSVYTQLGDALAARAAAYVDGHITHRVALWPPRLLGAPVLVPPAPVLLCALCRRLVLGKLRPTPFTAFTSPDVACQKRLPQTPGPRCLREIFCTGSASLATSDIASPPDLDRDGSTPWRPACSRWLPPSPSAPRPS